MRHLTLSAASRKNTSTSSPRAALAYETNTISSFDNQMLRVNESDESGNACDKLKDPRICNERSDSGFSECSNCSTPSASCICHLTSSQHHDKSDTIIEENHRNSSESSIEPHEISTSIDAEVINSDHEVSSLEYDDKANCDNNDIIAVSIQVPIRQELYQDEHATNEIELRKASLENITRKLSLEKHSEYSELLNLKKINKVALLTEKFNCNDDKIAKNEKAKSPTTYSVTNGKGLPFLCFIFHVVSKFIVLFAVWNFFLSFLM
jgi:hypothetical protein